MRPARGSDRPTVVPQTRASLAAAWPEASEGDFIAGVRISGNDRNGLLNDVTNAISNFNNTNIRGVTLNTKDSLFDGQFVLYVKDINHLNTIIDRLKRIKSITKVERFDE